jgi:phosphoserine phosphatase
VATHEQRRAAIVYDFDGTLARGNMQEHSFIPALGIEVEAFWREVASEAKARDADAILTYMRLMLEHARRKQVPVTRESLLQHGADVALFDGLDTWFARMNAHAARERLTLDHYVVSSGLHEMIMGCRIFGEFATVFASRFVYDDAGHATFPGVAINYTTKTQFLFRINKGIYNSWDNETLNRWMPQSARPVPFRRMIFIGDGDTDIPSMKMVREQGGHSLAVYDPEQSRADHARRNIFRLIAEDRVHFVAPADYRDGSQLDCTVRGILTRLASDAAEK